MMEKTTSEDQGLANDNYLLTSEEEHLSRLYQAVNVARSIDVDEGRMLAHRYAAGRIFKKRLLGAISIAAALLIFAGIWWWFERVEVETVSEPQIVSKAVPERSDKALLVLSDGSLVNLDTLNMVQLTDAGLAISSSKGSMLAYEASNTTYNAAQKTNKIIVPAGGRFQLRLSDGTSAWLNAASSLEYPVAFGKGERIVRLSGEAFFEVAADPKRPFIIETTSGRIQVLGTSFNVSAYQDDEFMETTLVSGSLQVVVPSGQTSRLSPGQQHKLNQRTLDQTVNTVDTKFYTSWRDGVIYFNRVSLKELAIKLERWYDVQIVFEDERSARLIFSGAVENSRRLDFLLTLIAEASGIEFKINGKQVTIK